MNKNGVPVAVHQERGGRTKRKPGPKNCFRFLRTVKMPAGGRRIGNSFIARSEERAVSREALRVLNSALFGKELCDGGGSSALFAKVLLLNFQAGVIRLEQFFDERNGGNNAELQSIKSRHVVQFLLITLQNEHSLRLALSLLPEATKTPSRCRTHPLAVLPSLSPKLAGASTGPPPCYSPSAAFWIAIRSSM